MSEFRESEASRCLSMIERGAAKVTPPSYALTPAQRDKLLAGKSMEVVPQTNHSPPEHKTGRVNKSAPLPVMSPSLVAAVSEILSLGDRSPVAALYAAAKKHNIDVESLRSAVYRQRKRNKTASLAGREKYVVQASDIPPGKMVWTSTIERQRDSAHAKLTKAIADRDLALGESTKHKRQAAKYRKGLIYARKRINAALGVVAGGQAA